MPIIRSRGRLRFTRLKPLTPRAAPRNRKRVGFGGPVGFFSDAPLHISKILDAKMQCLIAFTPRPSVPWRVPVLALSLFNAALSRTSRLSQRLTASAGAAAALSQATFQEIQSITLAVATQLATAANLTFIIIEGIVFIPLRATMRTATAMFKDATMFFSGALTALVTAATAAGTLLTNAGMRSLPIHFARMGSIIEQQVVSLYQRTLSAETRASASMFKDATMFFLTTAMNVATGIASSLPGLVVRIARMPTLFLGRLGAYRREYTQQRLDARMAGRADMWRHTWLTYVGAIVSSVASTGREAFVPILAGFRSAWHWLMGRLGK